MAQNAMPAGTHPMAAQPNSTGPCTADRQKLCKTVQPGGGKLMDCFEAHKAQLSPACRTRMEPLFSARDRTKARTGAPGINMQTSPPAPNRRDKPARFIKFIHPAG